MYIVHIHKQTHYMPKTSMSHILIRQKIEKINKSSINRVLLGQIVSVLLPNKLRKYASTFDLSSITKHIN